MLGDILNALKLLLDALKTSDDKKRERVAKEVLRIYLGVADAVETGRKILSMLNNETSAHRGVSISLLTQQLQALHSLSDRLTSKRLVGILSLHLPRFNTALLCLLSAKGSRVWCTLDQLVTDSQAVSPEEWVCRLESRMLPAEDSPKSVFFIATSEIVRLEDVPGGMRTWYPLESLVPAPSPDLILAATPDEIKKAREELDQIAKAGEQLRSFLIEKFKFEDVL